MEVDPGITKENYRFLQQFAASESGIIIEDEKPYFFESRLTPVLQRNNVASINVLCSLLRLNAQPDLRREVRNSITTHETLFFRDKHPFDALQTTLLPEITAANSATRRIRIWSAAAASGQEAYSLVMLLHEMNLADWNISVLATDISDEILEKARAGRFMRLETNRGLPANYLLKYFDPAGLHWDVKPQIRNRIEFRQFDLRSNPVLLGQFDLIFCRNVLIYFDQPTRSKILKGLASCLQPNGYLTLGAAEAVTDPTIGLQRRIVGPAVFYTRERRESGK